MLYQMTFLISVHCLVILLYLSYFWEIIPASKLSNYPIEIYLVCFPFNNTFYKLIISQNQNIKIMLTFWFSIKQNLCFVRQDYLLECIKKKNVCLQGTQAMHNICTLVLGEQIQDTQSACIKQVA